MNIIPLFEKSFFREKNSNKFVVSLISLTFASLNVRDFSHVCWKKMLTCVNSIDYLSVGEMKLCTDVNVSYFLPYLLHEKTQIPMTFSSIHFLNMDIE